jgi:hypothetical protein
VSCSTASSKRGSNHHGHALRASWKYADGREAAGGLVAQIGKRFSRGTFDARQAQLIWAS